MSDENNKKLKASQGCQGKFNVQGYPLLPLELFVAIKTHRSL